MPTIKKTLEELQEELNVLKDSCGDITHIRNEFRIYESSRNVFTTTQE